MLSVGVGIQVVSVLFLRTAGLSFLNLADYVLPETAVLMVVLKPVRTEASD